MPASVSIVIPCYRQAHFLAEAIDSILSQTHPADQIIVVDDGSPDDVAAVVARYPEVHYIRQENRGLGPARNRGLAECIGDFVVFLDSDDRLLPPALEAGVVALTAREDCGLVWGGIIRIDTSGQLIPSEPRTIPSSPGYIGLLEANIVGTPSSVMFRRSVLNAVGGFWDLRLLVEDWELYLRIARKHPIAYHGTLVAEHRTHGQNISADTDRMYEGGMAALGRQAAWVRNDPAARRALRRGRRNVRISCGSTKLLKQLHYHRLAGHWWGVTRTGVLLLRYPSVFVKVLLYHTRRVLRRLDEIRHQ